MRRTLVLLLSLSISAESGAQIIRQRFQLSQPSVWVSLGAALQQGFTVKDGATASVWQFGSSTQYVASIEKALSGGTSFGLRGTHSRVPLAYSGRAAASDADANVSQLFGTLHFDNGGKFHTVIELSAGGTMYSGFRSRVSGSRLEPLDRDIDFSFAFGYGFGYSFSPRFSVDFVQDVGTSMHQKDGLGAGDDSSVRMHSTRVVGRFGLGGR